MPPAHRPMRLLTLIANSLDGRMLRDILALEGLHVQLVPAPAEVRQGGAVALLIEDDEFDRARATLARWAAEHPGIVSDPPRPTDPA